MKTFFGGTFIEKEKLEAAGRNYPMKLEYYKQINEDGIYGKEKYGIHIVKTEYIPNNLKVETKDIKYITNDELELNNILNIFKENQVGVVNTEEILSEIVQKRFLL